MTDEYETPLTGADVAVGDESPELVVENVSRVDFARYAGASGDFNPLHVDESYATDAGYPSVFGHGMFTAGLAAHLLGDWFGLARVEEFRVRFTDQVWPGDTLTVVGEVTERESVAGDEATERESSTEEATERESSTEEATESESSDHVRVECEFTVENQDGEAVLTGDATAALPP